MSTGPLWSDVVQRITANHETGGVICVEEITGKENSRQLHRDLPDDVKVIRAILVYEKVAGHPDPGVPYQGREEAAPAEEDEDGRVIRRIKRSLEEAVDGANPGASRGSRAAPKSPVFGMWVADVKTERGDKSRFVVVANSRDLELLKKVLNSDTYYVYSELHSGWICLTKKSGKELQERLLTAEEKEVFKEAKLLEIENLESGNAIEFITDRSKCKWLVFFATYLTE